MTLTWYASEYRVQKIRRMYSLSLFSIYDMFIVAQGLCVPLVEFMYPVFTRMPGESYADKLPPFVDSTHSGFKLHARL